MDNSSKKPSKVIRLFCFPRGLFSFHHTISYSDDTGTASFVSHAHNCYEIMQLLKGDIIYIIDGKHYKMNQGDIIIIKKDEFHVINVLSSVYERRVLEFNSDMFMFLPFAQNDFLLPFESHFKSFFNHIAKEQHQDFNINGILDKIETNIDEKFDSEINIYIYLLELIMEIKRVFISINDHSQLQIKNPIVDSIYNYINENIEKPLTLEILEKHFNMSKYYISHLFKQVMGTSIIKYIRFKKIHYAENLLLNGVSPTVVSRQLSFNNYANFHSAYKKVLNISPSDTYKSKK